MWACWPTACITVASEWRHIDAAPMQKIGYVFTFPIFMFTYIPISVAGPGA